MIFLDDYLGCTAIVRNEENEKALIKSMITKHDKTMATIEIDGNLSCGKQGDKVSLLILCKNTVHEYNGTLRKVATLGVTEIALYNGKIKEERESKRYEINFPAVIKNIIVENRIVPLDNCINVVVLNISTVGALIRTFQNALEDYTNFQLTINISGEKTVINSKIVRKINDDENITEYACKFISLEE